MPSQARAPSWLPSTQGPPITAETPLTPVLLNDQPSQLRSYYMSCRSYCRSYCRSCSCCNSLVLRALAARALTREDDRGDAKVANRHKMPALRYEQHQKGRLNDAMRCDEFELANIHTGTGYTRVNCPRRQQLRQLLSRRINLLLPVGKDEALRGIRLMRYSMELATANTLAVASS